MAKEALQCNVRQRGVGINRKTAEAEKGHSAQDSGYRLFLNVMFLHDVQNLRGLSQWLLTRASFLTAGCLQNECDLPVALVV
jgi:hypothetical protein